MVGSVSSTAAYYNLLAPQKSTKSSSSPILGGISSSFDSSKIAAEETASDEKLDSIKLSPEVSTLLTQLNSNSNNFVGGLLGGDSGDNALLNAAASAAMKQAYALISRSAYQGAINKSTQAEIAAAPMDNILSSYHSALNGEAPEVPPVVVDKTV